MNGNENVNENENENNNENKNKNVIKKLNDYLDEIIDKSKSFEEQIKLLRKVENLVKLRLAHLANIIDEELFAKIFGYALEALASKLINTTDKEEYQIIVNNIK